MAWSFLLNFNDGGGNRDITALVDLQSIRRKFTLWNDLQPTANTLTFDLNRDSTILTLLLTNDNSTDITVTKDAAAYFKGTVRPNFKVSVGPTVKQTKIECVDLAEKLKRKIDTTFAWESYKVCDTVTPASSILHQLLIKAGFELTDINVAVDIDKTIDYFVNVPVHADQTYWDALTSILFEFGYVWYFGADGKFNIYNFLPTSTTTSDAFDNSNMLDELVINKKLMSYEGTEIRLYTHKTEAGALVFNDTTGGDADHPCNIELAAAANYPEGSADRYVYSEYQFEGGEIVIVKDAAISVTKESGINYDDAFVSYYKRALFSFVNSTGSPLSITKLQITGDVTYKGDLTKCRCLLVAGTEKLFTHDAQWITTTTDGDKLAIGLARHFKYADFTYTLHSKEVYALGGFVDIEDEMLGIDNRCVIVGIEDINPVTGEMIYSLEGIEEYSAESVENEGTFIPAPPPAPGSGPAIVDGTSPTYTEVIEGFTDGGGTKTPTVPTIAVCKPVGTHAILLQWDRQLDLTNFSRYEVQVSSDNSTWYSLKFDGTGWGATLDADTDWASEVLVHAGIPHTGDADAPAGQLLYYRVRRVTKEPTASNWSTAASATTNVVATGDLAGNSVYANNLRADSITATLMQTGLLAASVAVVIGYAGTGTPASPDEGDRRVYIDDDELGMQEYTNGAWTTVNQIQIGGINADGVFLPFLGCRGLYGGDPPDPEPLPDEDFYHFDFDSDYLDQDDNDWWTTEQNVTRVAGKFGNCLTRNTDAESYLYHMGVVGYGGMHWTPGEDQAFCCWFKAGTSEAANRTLLYLMFRNTTFNLTYFEVILNASTLTLNCVIDDTLEGTVSSGSGVVQDDTWHFLGVVFHKATDTMYLIVDDQVFDGAVDDEWSTVGTELNSSFYIYPQAAASARRFYFDDFLIKTDQTVEIDFFIQHYLHDQPWTADYSALDVVLKPATGGVVRVLGQLAISGASRVRAHRSTAQTITDATWTVVQYNSESFDNLGEWDTSNYRFTPQRAGLYFVRAHLLTASVAWTVGDWVALALYKNAVQYSRFAQHFIEAAVTSQPGVGGSDIIALAVGDYIDIRVNITRGANTDTVTDSTLMYVAIHRLS